MMERAPVDLLLLDLNATDVLRDMLDTCTQGVNVSSFKFCWP